MVSKFDEVFERLYVILDGLGSLMFAIDSTGSMSSDIEIAKNIAQDIVNLERNPVDYILSDIDDPSNSFSYFYHSCDLN